MTEANPATLTPTETTILSTLLASEDPVAKTALMKGVTESDASFKVLLTRLRKKGFDLKPAGRGAGVAAVYSLSKDERRLAKTLMQPA